VLTLVYLMQILAPDEEEAQEEKQDLII